MKDIEKENENARTVSSEERGKGAEPTREMQVRNSTVDFLIFTKDAGDDGINVLIEDDTVWLTQEGIATLFDKARTTISEHISNIYSTGELDSESTCRKFRHMGTNGQEYWPTHYNLDVIISVGYRVDSIRATQFRRWATNVLRDFTIKGYVLNKERCKFFKPFLFEELPAIDLIDKCREKGLKTPEFHFGEDGQVIIWRKNVTPGKGALRVKNILTELMSNRYITTDELAAKFKVSSRTITRDINSLRETYTIIWTPLSNTKGYWMVEHK